MGSAVGTAHRDVAVRPHGEAWQRANDEPGSAALLSQRQVRHPDLIVLEATGGLERLVVSALAGWPLAVVTPRQVRDCAKATGRLAKTDARDAAVLAQCADALRPQPRSLPDPQAHLLAAVVERRRQVVALLTAEKNRARQAVEAVRPRVQAHSTWLEQALADLDRERDEPLQCRPLWQAHAQLLRSVPGVSPTVACTRLADVPERGHLPTKRLAALVGLAPPEPRPWRLAWHPCHLGWPPAGARCPLPGRTGWHTL